jgi:hypothetical protein
VSPLTNADLRDFSFSPSFFLGVGPEAAGEMLRQDQAQQLQEQGDSFSSQGTTIGAGAVGGGVGGTFLRGGELARVTARDQLATGLLSNVTSSTADANTNTRTIEHNHLQVRTASTQGEERGAELAAKARTTEERDSFVGSIVTSSKEGCNATSPLLVTQTHAHFNCITILNHLESGTEQLGMKLERFLREYTVIVKACIRVAASPLLLRNGKRALIHALSSPSEGGCKVSFKLHDNVNGMPPPFNPADLSTPPLTVPLVSFIRMLDRAALTPAAITPSTAVVQVTGTSTPACIILDLTDCDMLWTIMQGFEGVDHGAFLTPLPLFHEITTGLHKDFKEDCEVLRTAPPASHAIILEACNSLACILWGDVATLRAVQPEAMQGKAARLKALKQLKMWEQTPPRPPVRDLVRPGLLPHRQPDLTGSTTQREESGQQGLEGQDLLAGAEEPGGGDDSDDDSSSEEDEPPPDEGRRGGVSRGSKRQRRGSDRSAAKSNPLINFFSVDCIHTAAITRVKPTGVSVVEFCAFSYDPGSRPIAPIMELNAAMASSAVGAVPTFLISGTPRATDVIQFIDQVITRALKATDALEASIVSGVGAEDLVGVFGQMFNAVSLPTPPAATLSSLNSSANDGWGAQSLRITTNQAALSPEVEALHRSAPANNVSFQDLARPSPAVAAWAKVQTSGEAAPRKDVPPAVMQYNMCDEASKQELPGVLPPQVQVGVRADRETREHAIMGAIGAFASALTSTSLGRKLAIGVLLIRPCKLPRLNEFGSLSQSLGPMGENRGSHESLGIDSTLDMYVEAFEAGWPEFDWSTLARAFRAIMQAYAISAPGAKERAQETYIQLMKRLQKGADKTRNQTSGDLPKCLLRVDSSFDKWFDHEKRDLKKLSNLSCSFARSMGSLTGQEGGETAKLKGSPPVGTGKAKPGSFTGLKFVEHREAFATAFSGKCIFFHGKLDCNNPGSCPYVHGDLMKPPEMTAFFTERHARLVGP